MAVPFLHIADHALEVLLDVAGMPSFCRNGSMC